MVLLTNKNLSNNALNFSLLSNTLADKKPKPTKLSCITSTNTKEKGFFITTSHIN